MSKSKNVNFQRVCLLIVEGPSDKISLFNILSKYLSKNKLRTYIMRTDITSESGIKPENIEKNLAQRIDSFLKQDKLKKSDITNIIHLTDLDGTFIDDKYVKFNKECEQPFYTTNDIQTVRPDSIKDRNHRKADNIRKLLTVDSILSKPYKLYFMSCNIDHVLHNTNNIDDAEKQRLAEEFADKFLGQELTFLDYLKKEGVIDFDTYEESWDKVQCGLNSLNRKTNIDKALKNSN